MKPDEFATRELARRAEGGLLRRLRPVDGAQGTWITIDGQQALSLCSNNYLGLANHPAVGEAAQQAIAEYGVGAGSSRLIAGSMRLHHQLEAELALLKGTEAALLFNSGYHANVGAITALVGADDAVFSDALNHASIIDGCRLARARVSVYPHNDIDALAAQLSRATVRRRLIVTESIFGMDGDRANLRAICDLAERYDAMVMVDEAHATGVLGANGGGLVEAEGLQDRVTVQMGTLGKALGTFGAFVAAQRSIIDLLINTARSFIYTTALPVPIVAAALAALRLVRSDTTGRERLAHNAATLAERLRQIGLTVGSPSCHIMPVLLGDAEPTMHASAQLLSERVFVQGIRPPTVPVGTARLRVTVMSTHTPEDLAFAAAAFERVFAGGSAVRLPHASP